MTVAEAPRVATTEHNGRLMLGSCTECCQEHASQERTKRNPDLFTDNYDYSMKTTTCAKAMQCYVEQADHVYLDVADVALDADVPIHRVMDWGKMERRTV